MSNKHIITPTAFVIFGAAGDLAWRKLMPSIFNLFMDGWLPEQFAIIGAGHLHQKMEDYLEYMKKGVKKFSRFSKKIDSEWGRFSGHIDFVNGDVDNDKLFKSLGQRLSKLQKEWNEKPQTVFYLAMPPGVVENIADGLAAAQLNQDRTRARIVVEKPFGHDLESAKALNRKLLKNFHENQIFRIDHYLGKETVQNILAFRFANTLFEPVWNRSYIDHVQITVAEQVGVGSRGHYYEKAGCLRDMIQNHLMQVLCLVAMEPPVSFHDNEIRNKKVDVIHAIRPILPEQVPQFAVRGQYAAGWLEGEHVKGYRHEENVAGNSFTETFASVKFFIDNWRWQDVPFYLRTGKRLANKNSEVCIQFKSVPHQPFPTNTLLDRRPNRLILAIQPEEGILLRFESKYPGPEMHLAPVIMRFFYRDTFQQEPHDAYETLLLDVMQGDATLFMRADQAEAAWSVLSNILDVWAENIPTDFPNYQAGSWGPEAAEILIAQDGRSWASPTQLICNDATSTCGVTLGE